MKGIKYLFPKNADAVGLLGYMVIANNQIHSYQLDELNYYLSKCHVLLQNTCLNAILDGKEDAISFEQALHAYGGEKLAVKKSLFFLLSVLAYVDAGLDEKEKEILCKVGVQANIKEEQRNQIIVQAERRAHILREDACVLFEPNLAKPVKHRNLFKKLISLISNVFSEFFHIIFRKKHQFDSAEDIKYREAIKLCAKVANDDFEIIKPCYEKIIEKCDSIVRMLHEVDNKFILKTKKSEFETDAQKTIGNFSTELSESVLKPAQDARELLIKKERSLPEFTISLLGRTKAGKSTLHTILTKSGKDKIGGGQQRTTRYNRVYQWNLLRLIDTPGIGSAESMGRSDEEIATSILDETDIICFVMVDDTTRNDSIDFLKKIAKRNKPIIILLNHKENIENPAKFKIFLKDSKHWLTSTGEDNLKGYIDRLYELAKKEGFDQLLSVYPVFLLAALMAQDPRYAEYSNILWESSNMEIFVNKLKQWIVMLGPIKRSQTLLDGTVQNFALAERKLQESLLPIEKNLQDIQKKRSEFKNFISGEKTKYISRLCRKLDIAFNYLKINKVEYFARIYYQEGHSREELPDLWRDFLKREEFGEYIGQQIQEVQNDFIQKVKTKVQDIQEDLDFSLQQPNIQGIEADKIFFFDLHIFIKVLGALVSSSMIIFPASASIAMILTAVGGVLSFLASLFKSKARKKQELIIRLRDDICKQLDTMLLEEKQLVSRQAEEQISEIIEKVDESFDYVIDILQGALYGGKELIKLYQTQNQWLNQVYAWRILSFLSGDIHAFQESMVRDKIIDVERDFQKFRIHVGMNMPDIISSTDVLKEVMSEKIEIIK